MAEATIALKEVPFAHGTEAAQLTTAATGDTYTMNKISRVLAAIVGNGTAEEWCSPQVPSKTLTPTIQSGGTAVSTLYVLAFENFVNDNFPGIELVTLTTTSTATTYQSRKFSEIVGVLMENTSDDDGGYPSWSGKTVTANVATSGDVVKLFIVGRK